MATLAEKLAAKKALAAAPKMVDVTVKHVEDTIPVVEEKKEALCKPIQNSVQQSELTQAKTIPADVPLTFAERMALKKALEKAQAAGAPIVAATQPPITPSLPVAVPIAAKSEESSISSTKPNEADAKTAQAYADIKAKINLLSDMSESDLPDAMKDLKASLLQNPQACYLMLPQDIGQMVIALRAMRQEAVVEATTTKEKGPKKARASKNLTAEEIAAAFDSL